MLRHLKMEIKKQEAALMKPQSERVEAAEVTETKAANSKGQRRIRGRRSSKPQMEKRRRARINQCLDTLKSYVLNDSANLSRLGIDVGSNENHDEETIARRLLKSSGLINRHRGRKNPNKLEKADILELTVDYVRRLHEQRDELAANLASCQTYQIKPSKSYEQPLILDLIAASSKDVSKQQAHLISSCPPSPPSSSAGCSPQPLLSISSNIQQASHVLDLSDSKRVRFITQTSQTNNSNQTPQISVYQNCQTVLFERPDGIWKAWNSQINNQLK